MIHKPCKICSSENWITAYEGKVRHGAFGQSVPGKIFQCTTCGVEYLTPIISDLKSYYQSDAYRKDIGEVPDPQEFFKAHDQEQFLKYHLLADIPLRNRVIADVGSAAGSFLDGVSGFASTTIAIEPANFYHDSLKQRGHLVYPDTSSAIPEWGGRVDLAVCFSVIEHIEDPVKFLQDIYTLLSENGCLLISTPNRRDILLELGCSEYRSFFYRTAHIYYFDEKSLGVAAETAGFKGFEAKFVHRFNYANFIEWLRSGKPSGNQGNTVLGPAFDRVWQGALEEKGVSDYLYAYLRKQND